LTRERDDVIRQASGSKRIAKLARDDAEKSAQAARNAQEQEFMAKRKAIQRVEALEAALRAQK
jgi:hypothetical protein